ncbi:NAD-dependent epimerase/dehydratase family protein [Sphaerimonospora thailandensis]|uniref:NAD dependent epimerase/dehydratase n=1 Tax=Sphaerimonospora thailandensis TaxID=795644 RepID=A0A8J3RBK3_9ACTN|nr:NAD-dependent epimerase/dehydratase family protein [Sphaerimonospora thailandensis]GIH71595.1 NAD dependent epimerase/dehydratase [Sphaerimonospora thailandensis]
MATIAVVGGTRFFGKTLVRDLLAQGHEVTIITRGLAPDDFGDTVTRLRADANDADRLTAAVTGSAFDVVYHQMCYSPAAALAAVRAFDGRAGKLVMTSSLEVYNKDTFRWRMSAPPMSAFAEEAELDPSSYDYDVELPWSDPDFAGTNYGEGKRQAEAYLSRNATFPVAFARLAHVLAFEDEFTGRFRFHFDRIRDGRRMASFPTPGRTSFVSASDAAAFLSWLGEAPLTGAVNGASPDPASLYDMTAMMSEVIGGKVVIEEVGDAPGDPDLSAFSCPADFGLSVTSAMAAGFEFTRISTWLPQITRAAIDAER